MKQLNEKIFIVEGDLWTSMYLDADLITGQVSDNIIHVKGNIYFGVLRNPKNMKDGDYYMIYEDFIKQNGNISDIIAFSKI